MFHKRLLKEFSDNRKYVAGMVIMQWAALLANVALMYVLAAYVGRISGIVKGESLTTSLSDGVLLIVFAAALFVRIAATSAANRMSYLASTQVKRRLRDRIYEKMMEFGAAYREAVATRRRCRSRRSGVDQLEIYFGKYVPQFFWQHAGTADLVCDCWHHEYQGGGSAAALRTAHSGVDCGGTEVCQEAAGKILGNLHGTRRFLSGKSAGLVTLKIYQADGATRKDGRGGKSSAK